MMAKNVNVPPRVIEFRPKTRSCARCTVNSTIDSNEEMVSGTFCFIDAPVGACAPCSRRRRSYGIPVTTGEFAGRFQFQQAPAREPSALVGTADTPRQYCDARHVAGSRRQF